MTALLFVLLFLTGGLAWRLSTGPMDLAFAVGNLERALTPHDRSYDVRIQAAQLAWEGWDSGLQVRAVGVRLLRDDGAQFARLPAISFTLDPWRLALGEIAPSSITIRNPSVALERTAQGRVSIGLRRTASEGGSFLPGLLSAFSGDRPSGGPLNNLEAIRVDGGDLTIRDATLGRTWDANDLRARIWRTADGIQAELSFDLTIENREFRFRGEVEHTWAPGTTDARILFAGLDPALFEAASGPLKAFGWFQMPLSGTATFRVDGDQRLTGGQLEFTGSEGQIDIPEAYAEPLQVRSISGVANVSGDGSRVELGPMEIRFGEPILTLHGTIDQGGAGLRFDGRAVFTDLPTDDIGKYWPRNLAGKGRAWVVENISKGTIPQLAVDISLRRQPGDGSELELARIEGSFDFRGISVRYLPYMPPVEAVDGSSQILRNGMTFDATSGNVEGVRVTNADASIDWTDLERATMDLEVSTEGDLSRILELIDRPPLGYATALGAHPSAVTGNAKATLRTSYPLIKALELRDVAITVAAELTDVAWRRGLFGLDITEGRFDLDLDKEGMTLVGPAQLDQTQVALEWREIFSDNIEEHRKLSLRGTVTPELLTRLGAEAGELFRGAAEMSLKVTGHRNGQNVAEATFDLTRAELVLPFFGIRKPAGQSGTATIRAVLSGERPSEISSLSVESDAINLTASASFHDDGSTIRTLDVDSFRAGRTNASARVTGEPGGRKDITIEGEALDLQALLTAPEGESATTGQDEQAADNPPVTVHMRLQNLFVSDGPPMTEVTVRAEYDGTFIRSLSLDGTPRGGSHFTAHLRLEGDGQQFTASTGDAGALFHTLGIADNMRGGELRIGLDRDRIAEGVPFRGQTDIRNFVFVDAPKLARLIVFPEEDQRGAAARNRVDFEHFVAPMRLYDGVIDVRNGRATGSQIGITFGGRINLDSERLDLDGTVVPAYRLNSLLGHIPAIGRLIVGEKGSGVLAARWHAQGTLREPNLDVNTLSVLTPGFTRYILDIFRGDDTDAPDFDAPQALPDLREPSTIGP